MKSSDFTIRQLLRADAAEYRSLRLRCLREHASAFTSSYDEELAKPVSHLAQRLDASSPVRFWGAFVQGRLVGAVGLEREQRLKNRHKAVVIGMYVAPEQGRLGIGRALLAQLLDEARHTDLALLVLTVTQGNDAAERLYRDAGFTSFGVEPEAIQVDNRFFAKNHMYLQLTPS